MHPKNKNYLQHYLDNCLQMNKSDHTLAGYSSDLKKFINWYETRFAGKPLSKARAETIGDYKDWLSRGGRITPEKTLWNRLFKRHRLGKELLSARPLSVASRKRHLSSLKNFFEYLKQLHEDRGKIFLVNPVKSKLHGLRLKEVDTRPTPMLHPRQWETLWEHTWRPRQRLIIALLYHTGMRLSEAASLRVENIDIKGKGLTFVRKGGKVQTLWPANSRELFGQITYWLARREASSEWLISDKRGRPLTPRTLHNTVVRILRQAGIPKATPHSFRKAYATGLYLKTKDLLLVRDNLGHSDAKVTQGYIDKKSLQKR